MAIGWNRETKKACPGSFFSATSSLIPSLKAPVGSPGQGNTSCSVSAWRPKIKQLLPVMVSLSRHWYEDCRQQRNNTWRPPPRRRHKEQEVPHITPKKFVRENFDTPPTFGAGLSNTGNFNTPQPLAPGGQSVVRNCGRPKF